ncbi:MAG: ATP-binding protein [Ilumatobacteraceae bacterium]
MAQTWQAQRAGRMAADFRRSLAPIGSVNANERFEYEGADYRRMFVMPTEGLAATLVTTRELLVLACPFPEVQARTVKVALRELERSAGRLEPGMVIVLHDDPGGDGRLREWGKEQGLTVLPVLAAPRMPGASEIEAALCSGLYSYDPFDLAGPVRSAHQFYGRAEVPDLARRLRSGHIQSIFGIRKIGKTSVLHRLLQETADFHGVACAFVDCSDDSLSALSAGRLLFSIAGAVDGALNPSGSRYADVLPLETDVGIDEAGRILLQRLADASTPLLLAFDEIDYISPSSPVADHWRTDFNTFFRALRRVYQECARRQIPFSIVVAGVSSRWFSVDQIEGTENSALALVPESYLPPFTRRQSVEMIKALGRAAGLGLGDKAADLIAETCSDIPFWMRRAGSFINSCYSKEDRPVKVGVPEAKQLCIEFVEVEGGQLAYSSFAHLFRIYPELGPAAVECLLRSEPEVPQPTLSTLGRYGILGSGTKPSGPMVEAGLQIWQAEQSRELQPPVVERVTGHSAVAAGSSSAAGEEQWAELLSEVSKYRNVLERKVRDFLLAVLRADALGRQDGKKPADLVLQALPAERRATLQGKSLTAIVTSLYWTDLAAIIKKNWSMFDRFFGDRTKLELQFDIVNDRPDAHAKEIDGAELALQRRAMNWIEASIDRSGYT